jgi:tetratricopeptide (TPR) repeat protein
MTKVTHSLGFVTKAPEHPSKDEIFKFTRRLDLAQKQPNPLKKLEMEIKSLFGLVEIYEEIQVDGDAQQMNKYSKLLLGKTKDQPLYIKEYDRYNISNRALRALCVSYRNLNLFKEAIEYGSLALDLRLGTKSDQLDAILGLICVYIEKRYLILKSESTQSEKTDFAKGAQYVNMALEILPEAIQDKNDQQGIRSDIYLNSGIIQMSAGEIEKAFKHFSTALKISKARGINDEIAKVYTNLALCYTRKNDHQQALNSGTEAAKLYRTDPSDPEEELAQLFSNVEYCEKLFDFEQALEICQSYRDLARRLNNGEKLLAIKKIIHRIETKIQTESEINEITSEINLVRKQNNMEKECKMIKTRGLKLLYYILIK